MVDARFRVSDDLLKKYETVSNATVLGELSRHGYMKVFMNGVHSLAPGRRLVGRAVTLRYLPSRPDLQDYVTRGGHGDELDAPADCPCGDPPITSTHLTTPLRLEVQPGTLRN